MSSQLCGKGLVAAMMAGILFTSTNHPVNGYSIDNDAEEVNMQFDINSAKPQIRHYNNIQAGSVLAKSVKLGSASPDDDEIKRRLVAYDLDPILPPYDDVYDKLILKPKISDEGDLNSGVEEREVLDADVDESVETKDESYDDSIKTDEILIDNSEIIDQPKEVQEMIIVKDNVVSDEESSNEVASAEEVQEVIIVKDHILLDEESSNEVSSAEEIDATETTEAVDREDEIKDAIDVNAEVENESNMRDNENTNEIITTGEAVEDQVAVTQEGKPELIDALEAEEMDAEIDPVKTSIDSTVTEGEIKEEEGAIEEPESKESGKSASEEDAPQDLSDVEEISHHDVVDKPVDTEDADLEPSIGANIEVMVDLIDVGDETIEETIEVAERQETAADVEKIIEEALGNADEEGVQSDEAEAIEALIDSDETAEDTFENDVGGSAETVAVTADIEEVEDEETIEEEAIETAENVDASTDAGETVEEAFENVDIDIIEEQEEILEKKDEETAESEEMINASTSVEETIEDTYESSDEDSKDTVEVVPVVEEEDKESSKNSSEENVEVTDIVEETDFVEETDEVTAEISDKEAEQIDVVVADVEGNDNESAEIDDETTSKVDAVEEVVDIEETEHMEEDIADPGEINMQDTENAPEIDENENLKVDVNVVEDEVDFEEKNDATKTEVITNEEQEYFDLDDAVTESNDDILVQVEETLTSPNDDDAPQEEMVDENMVNIDATQGDSETEEVSSSVDLDEINKVTDEGDEVSINTEDEINKVTDERNEEMEETGDDVNANISTEEDNVPINENVSTEEDIVPPVPGAEVESEYVETNTDFQTDDTTAEEDAASKGYESEIQKPDPIVPSVPKSSANDEFVHGVNDIRQYLDEVDPPDELDITASGLSMQEVLIVQGKEIIKRSVDKGVNQLKRTYRTLKTKGVQKWNGFKDFMDDNFDVSVDDIALTVVEKVEVPYQNAVEFLEENADAVEKVKNVAEEVITKVKSLFSKILNLGEDNEYDYEDDDMDFGDLVINDDDMAEMRRKLMERYS